MLEFPTMMQVRMNLMNHENTPVEIIEVLRKAPKVALFSHVSPDGDCIGSMLAIGLALEKMGKEVTFYNPDSVPSYLSFLPDSSRISQELPSPQPKILLFVDCTDLGRVNLSRLDISGDGQLAIMILSAEDFRISGAELELSEGLVNHARSIAGVEVAVLLKEVGPQEIKAGLRSNLWLNVNEIAALFGGGGHQRAAGCTLRIPMAEAKQRLITALEEALRIERAH